MSPAWLRAVVLASDPRARALVARPAVGGDANGDRVFLGERCPGCGAALVLVARGRHAPAELHALLAAGSACPHPAPAAPGTPRRSILAPGRAATGRRAMATILVVDDDDAIRAFVAMALADEGYAVREARDGREALAVAAAAPPCAILLDMRMPTMDGWAFAAAYRARDEHPAPLVCMTAAADVGPRARAIAAAATLPKPFDLDALLATVGRFCPPG